MFIQRISVRFVGFIAISIVAIHAAPAAILHQYDFEQPSSPVTQAAWTHIDLSILATGSTAGFVGSQSSYGQLDRGSSTQAPIDVTRDLIIFRNNGVTANPGMRFRDIVPAYASSVLITLYRSDSVDPFGASLVTTKASLNGGSETTINSGGAYGTYQTPIAYTLAITPSVSTGTLDILQYSTTADGSDMRVNGISFDYTIQEVPEPSSLGLTSCGLCALWRVRRKLSSQASF